MAEGTGLRERTADAASPPAEPPRRRRRDRWGRRFAVGIAVALLLLASLYALRVPILVAVARAMEVREEPVRSDLIFLLNGDAKVGARARHAAELYHRGFAPLVVIARSEEAPAEALGLYPNETDVNVAYLRRAGVPDSAVRVLSVPGGVTSTTDEGRVLGAYLRRNPASRVLLVTSEYHTRRGRWAIRRGLGDLPVEVRVSGARDPRFHAGDWWRSEVGLLAYVEEYLKFLHNLAYR